MPRKHLLDIVSVKNRIPMRRRKNGDIKISKKENSNCNKMPREYEENNVRIKFLPRPVIHSPKQMAQMLDTHNA